MTVAVILAQALDAATWAAMPAAAEANVLVRGLHSEQGWWLKALLVVGVLALQLPLRPKYALVADVLVVTAIAAGCIGAGANLSVLTAIASETSRSLQEPAPIASEATGIEQGAIAAPAAPGRTPAPSGVGASPLRGVPVVTDASRAVAPQALGVLAVRPGIHGRASWVRASLGRHYLAARLPRGTRLTVCGPRGCIMGRVNDYGPSRRVFPGRVVDLSQFYFSAVCGSPAMGTCRVTVA